MNKITDVINNNIGNTAISNYISLEKKWRSSVTKKIGDNTTPIKINDKLVLTVLVHDNLWLHELGYMKEEIIEMLRKSDIFIMDLKFKYSPQKEILKERPKFDENPITQEIENEIYYSTLKFKSEPFYNELNSALRKYFTRYTLADYKSRNKL